jgi:crotonobetainyl-CoA:carnitine CoA-transferase CaiB-like acyl-CoA transferase
MMLRDVRLVSLAVNVPGPVAAAMLRDMGANVTKVEPPGGDPLKTMASGWYAELVRGVEVLTLDVKSDAGRARLDELLAGADILITSSRPGALARLGLGGEAFRARYPRLGHVSIVGYPSPDLDVAGHDLTYQAHEGLLEPPALPRTLVSDLAGAQQAVIAALALLVRRARETTGGFAEVSLSESARGFAAPIRHGLTAAGGVLGGGFPGYGLYRARDGWIALAALEPRFQAGVQRELGVSPSDADGLARVFATRTAEEWEVWAKAHDLPILPVGRSV